jgi:pimeloyl-ACP methyl ester carboxylesterase
MDVIHIDIPLTLTFWGGAAGGVLHGKPEHVANGGFTMTDIFVESWGAGTPVVLVHGSLATGAEEWQAQRPLAEDGYRLLVLDRRGYGRSPMIEGEDFLRDADDIVEVMGVGAHLVGHSYGGLGVLLAAVRRPEATLSLTLLEPGAFAMGQREPAARALVDDVRRLWDLDLPDEEWVVRFWASWGATRCRRS